MIYEYPDPSAPLRQGDIFVGLPRVDLSLQKVAILGQDGTLIETKWDDVAGSPEPLTAVVGVRPVISIVATQDCDTLHSPDITLCEIRDFRDVERKGKETKSPNSWKNIITQHARINQKWFYLPPDERLGFKDKMGVDFAVTLRVPREDLEQLRVLRRGRLNIVADEHFRERLAEFFRRYPYDEWYPLNREELQAYMREYPDTRPFPWQSSPEPAGDKTS